MLESYLIAIGVLSGIGGLLAFILAVADATIANYGECKIDMGEEHEPLKVKGGSHLLSYLFSQKIFVPSACGGQGTCGYCKIKVISGGGQVLATEETMLTKKEIRDSWRLACQVKVKSDVAIYLPPEYFAIKAYKAKVVSNKNVATFIKETVLELTEPNEIQFKSGQYIQLNVPNFKCSFKDFTIENEFRDVYDRFGFWNLEAKNKQGVIYRAYSMANDPMDNKRVILNVRIATPPKGCKIPGIASSYIFNLKPGDEVEISGPYGEFLIKDTQSEMCYIGGGAGMAPLRSHLFHLLKNQKTNRPITFWYGARSRREIFYQSEFEELERAMPNFKFTIALSEKQPGDNWKGAEGFIHSVCDQMHLSKHPDPTKIEYYLCGPPLMIDAVLDMLYKKYKVSEKMVMFDKF